MATQVIDPDKMPREQLIQVLKEVVGQQQALIAGIQNEHAVAAKAAMDGFIFLAGQPLLDPATKQTMDAFVDSIDRYRTRKKLSI